MRSSYFIRAIVAVCALAAPCAVWAEQAPLAEAGANTLTVFLRGAAVGTEQVAVLRTAEGWTIVSTGRFSAPVDTVARRIEVRYTADWRPRSFSLDGTARGVTQSIRTVMDGNQARSTIVVGGQPT